MNIQTDPSPYINSIPLRLPDSNKGTYGKVLVLAGCKGMSGAAYLSALASYRTGAGLVKFLTHEDNRTILQTLLPEAVYEGYEESGDVNELAKRNVQWADVIIAGPGLGNSLLSQNVLRETLKSIKAFSLDDDLIKKKSPLLILDADGLNILSKSPSLKEELSEITERIPVIITPHPMEMSRLSGKSLQEILENPALTASEYSKSHKLITIMKGSETIVSDKTGEKLFKNTLKSPALSKGGSGDVLSGAIAGMYTLLRAEAGNMGSRNKFNCEPSNRVDLSSVPTDESGSYITDGSGYEISESVSFKDTAYNAAVLAVIFHAEAGVLAAKQYGINGVLARDTANSLGRIIDSLSGQ